MHFHLQNRSFLLHEAYELNSPLDSFVLTAQPAEFEAWALLALELENRRELADQAHDRFKAALPMDRLLVPLLEELVGQIESSSTRPATLACPA
jgi:hypothetical protein